MIAQSSSRARRGTMTRALVAALLLLTIGSACHASPAGHLPMHYRVEPAQYPWTGRLHAVTFQTATLEGGLASVLSQWEAGHLLDQRDPASRRLYIGGGGRATGLHWHALDRDQRDGLSGGNDLQDGSKPHDGKRAVAWLRGQLGMAGMRPRDTRLGHAGDARVHVVPPPIWQPLMPGHDRFRIAHARRPHTVWLGTRTGSVHGFDAVSGHEIAAFLPRALLPQAAVLTIAGKLPPLRVPCPRPDTIDADLRGEWRTLLLCGVPAVDDVDVAGDNTEDGPAASGEAIDTDRHHESVSHSANGGDNAGAAIFALDITTADAQRPIALIWELAATDALPLTGSGPLRAAALVEYGVRRWYAVAIVAHADHSGLALIPLDVTRPRAIRQIPLPPHGCDATQRAGRLLAASVLADARGMARSIHALDNLGQLWRFPIPENESATQPPVCVLKLRGAASRRVEAPLILPGVVVPLIAVGSGSEVAVVPATTSARGSDPRAIIRARRPHGEPSDGVMLRADGASDQGWTFVLPHAGERFERWLPAGNAHLAFTTLSADGGRRSYLLDAMRGISPVVTGLPTGAAEPVVTITPIRTDGDTTPGVQRSDIESVALWTVDADNAQLQQQVHHIRRRGRLGWRELTRSSP